MVKHFSTSNKVACGRKNHNLISGLTIDGVTCKTCRNSEAFRAAVAAANTVSPDPVKPVRVAVQVREATVTRVAGIAFGEWLHKLGKGEGLPRGRYFAGKSAGEVSPLRAYQVGDSDVVAAYDPQGAIAAMCEQTGQALDEWELSDVKLVGNKRLDALEIYNQDEGVVEKLKTSLRQDLATLTKPAYLFGWE